MAATPGQRLEDPAEGHPALDRAGGSQRRSVGEQSGLTIGQQDLGAKVSRASRAPMDAMVVIGLTRISPAPRNNSAHATAQTSARLARITMPLPPRRNGAPRPDSPPRPGQVGLGEPRPGVLVGGGPGVVALEGLVASVIRSGGGEMRAAGASTT